MKKFSPLTFIPTFAFVGFLPKMPGTWGSIVAYIVFLIPDDYFKISLIILFFTLLISSIPLINKMELDFGNDPSIVVIDEVLAMWLIFMFDFINSNIVLLILSFVLFRIFDISKVLLISKINNRKGAIYVVLDDLVAAIYTITILFFINLLLFV